MYLLERLWAVATAVTNILTLSPFEPAPNQKPLHGPAPFSLEQQLPLDLSSPASSSIAAPDEVVKGPIFRPPGSPAEGDFQCDYSNMPGFVPCSTRWDRGCWLVNPATGQRYDINTDYETEFLNGTTRTYDIVIAENEHNADGMEFTAAKLFNEQYPGPWIEACWGDTIVVNVTNKLQTNGTSIHWHGIRQLFTTQMDGVNGVTQCPIAPGDSFVYTFSVTQYGSSWYHSHYSVQYADGAAGPITLHGPTSGQYDEAISPPLIMTDWGHDSAFISVINNDFNCEDILLNGLGDVTKFTDQKACVNTTQPLPPYQIHFDSAQRGRPRKKYLLRIINTSFDTTFIFSIDNHRLSVISADFVHIHPYSTEAIIIAIGQRYDVIVEATPIADNPDTLPSDGNYWIRTYIADCDRRTGPATEYETTGILRYNSSSQATPTSTAWNISVEPCVDEPYESLVPIVPWNIGNPVNGPQGEVFDLWSQGSNDEPYPLAFWSLNNNTRDFLPLRIDYTDPSFLNLEDTGSFNASWRVQPENHTGQDWVWFVLASTNRTFADHPIHLHGHDFAILEQAYNKSYDPSTVSLKLNNPPRRDVALLPKTGYLIIAFKADNPGTWLLHCHIAFHISGGLGFQILEDQPLANKLWPNPGSEVIQEADRVCAAWKDWYDVQSNWDPTARDCSQKDPPICFQDDSGV